jgi:branched-subunit amino acid aminotransferase/4-amino-4-deoxychorismate lyase
MAVTRLNGRDASADDLRPLAIGNYGHFTAMQVRGRAVQGLRHHIARLQAATRELFDVELAEDRIRDALRDAVLLGPADASLRLTVFARTFDYRDALRQVDVDLLVTLSPPTSPDKPPLRVKPYVFTRPLPHIKHVATFPLFHYRRQALREGWDDALFVAQDGALIEGSIWNLGLWDGQQVVWPEGPALRGTHEALLREGLAELGVPQSSAVVRLTELPRFQAGFACNASGLQAVTAIDQAQWPVDQDLVALLGRALATRPWEPLA